MSVVKTILIILVISYGVTAIITFAMGLVDMCIGSEFGEKDNDYIRGRTLCKNAWRPVYAVKKVVRDNLEAAKEKRK